jgi:hypothetical protein
MREISVARELRRFMFLHPGRLDEPSLVVKPRRDLALVPRDPSGSGIDDAVRDVR